jgi:hypothetical protein
MLQHNGPANLEQLGIVRTAQELLVEGNILFRAWPVGGEAPLYRPDNLP